MVKCLPEFEYFTVFLKNRNFISKIRRSKVTDYAALTKSFRDFQELHKFGLLCILYKDVKVSRCTFFLLSKVSKDLPINVITTKLRKLGV